jgi:hypothetical protein
MAANSLKPPPYSLRELNIQCLAKQPLMRIGRSIPDAITSIPIPAADLLFGSGQLVQIGIARLRKFV